MDIEGYEPLALKGMRRTIARHRPAIITEFFPRSNRNRIGVDPLAYLKAIASSGYDLAIIERNGHVRPTAGPESIMRGIRDDQTYLDILAQPVE
jgi:hypothetical protein